MSLTCKPLECATTKPECPEKADPLGRTSANPPRGQSLHMKAHARSREANAPATLERPLASSGDLVHLVALGCAFVANVICKIISNDGALI